MNFDLSDLLLRALRAAPVQHKQTLPYLCLFAFAMASAIPAFAATVRVSNTNDSGSGSLRNAIATANSGDTITFSLPNPSTITLASTLSICNSQTLTIMGPGASQVAISGNSAVQVLNVCGGVTLTLSGVTIEKGSAFGSLGGGIENYGTLAVSNSTLTGNFSDTAGGGIFNFGTLTVTNSTLSGNSTTGGCSSGQGGGISSSSGTVTVTDSTLTGNSANCEGGGIFNRATLTYYEQYDCGQLHKLRLRRRDRHPERDDSKKHAVGEQYFRGKLFHREPDYFAGRQLSRR